MDANESSIHNAALNSDLAAVESKLHADPTIANSVDGDKRTALHWACVSGSFEIFALLLSLPESKVELAGLANIERPEDFGQYHVDVNAQDDGGWTPLMIAISAGHERIYEILLSLPTIKLSLLNRGGQSILHFASSKARIPAVQSILATTDGKKLLRVKDLQGQLPLHRAAARGSLPIVDMLLTSGSQLSISDTGGWTALHHACSEGHGDVAVKLIQEGIDLDKTDRDGETAIKLCPRDGKCERFIRMSCPDNF